MEEKLHQLSNRLRTKMLAHDFRYYKEISSTNDEARKLADAGAKEGTVVIAEVQSAGKGRLGRTWVSPHGGIWLTMILRPNVQPSRAQILTLLAGMIVSRTIRQITDLKATVKWPNDVRIRGKKVCGILTELSTRQDTIEYVLIGIGINANNNLNSYPVELREQITTLKRELEQEVDRIYYIKRLMESFEVEYLKFNSSSVKSTPLILNNWRQLSDTLGREVRVETINGTIEGLAVDIAKDGALLVLSETGDEFKILAGDCLYLNQ